MSFVNQKVQLCHSCLSIAFHSDQVVYQQITSDRLFIAFQEENLCHFWNLNLAEAMQHAYLIGKVNMYTLLIGGPDIHMEAIKLAWTKRLLKAPKPFVIESIGEVNPITCTNIPQSQSIPLQEAICHVVYELQEKRSRRRLTTSRLMAGKSSGGNGDVRTSFTSATATSLYCPEVSSMPDQQAVWLNHPAYSDLASSGLGLVTFEEICHELDSWYRNTSMPPPKLLIHATMKVLLNAGHIQHDNKKGYSLCGMEMHIEMDDKPRYEIGGRGRERESDKVLVNDPTTESNTFDDVVEGVFSEEEEQTREQLNNSAVVNQSCQVIVSPSNVMNGYLEESFSRAPMHLPSAGLHHESFPNSMVNSAPSNFRLDNFQSQCCIMPDLAALRESGSSSSFHKAGDNSSTIYFPPSLKLASQNSNNNNLYSNNSQLATALGLSTGGGASIPWQACSPSPPSQFAADVLNRFNLDESKLHTSPLPAMKQHAQICNDMFTATSTTAKNPPVKSDLTGEFATLDIAASKTSIAHNSNNAIKSSHHKKKNASALFSKFVAFFKENTKHQNGSHQHRQPICSRSAVASDGIPISPPTTNCAPIESYVQNEAIDVATTVVTVDKNSMISSQLATQLAPQLAQASDMRSQYFEQPLTLMPDQKYADLSVVRMNSGNRNRAPAFSGGVVASNISTSTCWSCATIPSAACQPVNAVTTAVSSSRGKTQLPNRLLNTTCSGGGGTATTYNNQETYSSNEMTTMIEYNNAGGVSTLANFYFNELEDETIEEDEPTPQHKMPQPFQSARLAHAHHRASSLRDTQRPIGSATAGGEEAQTGAPTCGGLTTSITFNEGFEEEGTMMCAGGRRRNFATHTQENAAAADVRGGAMMRRKQRTGENSCRVAMATVVGAGMRSQPQLAAPPPPPQPLHNPLHLHTLSMTTINSSVTQEDSGFCGGGGGATAGTTGRGGGGDAESISLTQMMRASTNVSSSAICVASHCRTSIARPSELLPTVAMKTSTTPAETTQSLNFLQTRSHQKSEKHLKCEHNQHHIVQQPHTSQEPKRRDQRRVLPLPPRKESDVASQQEAHRHDNHAYAARRQSQLPPPHPGHQQHNHHHHHHENQEFI